MSDLKISSRELLDKLEYFNDLESKIKELLSLEGHIDQITNLIANCANQLEMKCVIKFLRSIKRFFADVNLDEEKIHQFFEPFQHNNSLEFRPYLHNIVEIIADKIQPEYPILLIVFDDCLSPVHEISYTAKSAAKVLCSYIDQFCLTLLKDMPKPLIFEFIPHFKTSQNTVQNTIGLLYHLFSHDYEYLDELIVCIFEFSKRIGLFPQSIFSKIMTLLDQDLTNEDFINNIIRRFYDVKPILLPQQLKDLLQFAKILIFDVGNYMVPLKLFYKYDITIKESMSIQHNDPLLALYIIRTLPELPEYSLYVIKTFLNYKSQITTPEMFDKYIRAIIPFSSFFENERSHIVIQILRHFFSFSLSFARFSFKSIAFQKSIALFLDSINDDMAINYIDTLEMLDSSDICDELIAILIKLSYLCDNNVTEFQCNNYFYVGKALFMIGEYKEAANNFRNCISNSFDKGLYNFTCGEIAFLQKDFVSASQHYKVAEHCFISAGPHYNLQSNISAYRFCVAALINQINILRFYMPEDLREWLNSAMFELKNVIRELPTSSILLAPEVDEVSNNYVSIMVDSTNKALNLLSSLGERNVDIDEVLNILSQYRVVPPAFFEKDPPVTFDDDSSIESKKEICYKESRRDPDSIDDKRETYYPPFFLPIAVSGSVVNKMKQKLKVSVSTASSYDDYTTAPELKTYIPDDEPISLLETVHLDSKDNGKGYLKITITIAAQLPFSSISYTISKIRRSLMFEFVDKK